MQNVDRNSTDIYVFFIYMYLKILMIFGFAIKMSVKLFTDILHLFAKFQWKFPLTFCVYYWRYRRYMYLAFVSKTLVEISTIFYIYLQNVDGNFHWNLLLSVNPITIWVRIFWILNLQKKEQFVLKCFTFDKSMVF